MKIHEILDKLEGVRPGEPGQWSALCPAHDDTNPSLSVAIGENGSPVLHCHAGCSIDDVLAALGFEKSDLFAESPSGAASSRRIEAEYDYCEEDGELAFQVVRYEPKGFRQRRPDGRGGWIWNVRGVRKLVFRLPQVRAAIERGDPIYVPEGEKDALAIEGQGFAATCNAGGAGKWRDEHSEQLRGAHVRIVADLDDDETGRRHAWDVAAKLKGVAASIVVLESIEGKDVSDHFAAGRSLDELVEAEPYDPNSEHRAQLTLTDLFDALPALSKDSSLEDVGAYLDAARDVLSSAVGIRQGIAREWLISTLKTVGAVGSAAGLVDEMLDEVEPAAPREERDDDSGESKTTYSAETIEKARKLLSSPDLLELADETMTRCGLIGEEVNRRIAFLAAVAGHAGEAIHLVVHGASSGGKNTLVKAVTDLLPPDRVLFFSGLSTHALEYLGGVIEGVLVIDEAEGQQDAEYQLRQAMSEGRVTRLTVGPNESGELTAQRLEVEVRASLFTTTTLAALHDENQTRVFDLWIDDSDRLTREILTREAERAAGLGSERNDELVETWRAAMDQLRSLRVAIPFAMKLAESFPASPIRVRRDFKRVLSLVRACTLLHQAQRERDDGGRLVASVLDYELVLPLIQAVVGPSITGMNTKAEAILDLFMNLARKREGDEKWISRTLLISEAEKNGIASPNTVKKWCKTFCDLGYWESRVKDRKRQYFQVRNPLKEPLQLPNPDDLREEAA